MWSISGLEGTLRDPRLIIQPETTGTWLTQVRGLLTDVVAGRWEHRPRPDDQKTIVVMVDAMVASGDLVNVIAAVSKDQKGGPLFPDVQLATGFDTSVAAAAKPPEPPLDKPPGPAAANKRDRDNAVLQQEEAARFADLLTSDSSANASLDGQMRARAPGTDLGAQIDAVRESGPGVTVGGGASRSPRGDGGSVGVATGTGRGPSTVGPGVASGSSTAPSGRISITSKSALEDTSLTTDAVLSKIQSVYMSGLKRCYKEALKQNPDLKGSVTLGFAVNESGRATAVTVTGMDEVDTCMKGLIASWRFPIPRDAVGEVTEASFRIKLQMVPD